MGGCEGKVLLGSATFGLTTGRDVPGSSRGRIGNTIVGTGFDGSFVPCAEAAPQKTGTQKTTVKNSIDARIFRPFLSTQRDSSDPVPAAGQAFREPASRGETRQ
jgi:hypothetical protein